LASLKIEPTLHPRSSSRRIHTTTGSLAPAEDASFLSLFVAGHVVDVAGVRLRCLDSNQVAERSRFRYLEVHIQSTDAK
jgi:hypothetical protein